MSPYDFPKEFKTYISGSVYGKALPPAQNQAYQNQVLSLLLLLLLLLAMMLLLLLEFNPAKLYRH